MINLLRKTRVIIQGLLQGQITSLNVYTAHVLTRVFVCFIPNTGGTRWNVFPFPRTTNEPRGAVVGAV